MSDPIEFVRQCIDEEERIALAATPGPWKVTGLPYEDGDDPAVIAADGRWVAGLAYDGQSTSVEHEVDEDAIHIARHDPARVLREVEAKRQIIDDCELFDHGGTSGGDLARLVLLALALPYVDHADYRPEWRP